MRMSELFTSTKEVSLEEFMGIWFKGGEMDIGNQYSNMDKYNYLEYTDNAAIEQYEAIKKEREEFIKSLVDAGECFLYPLTFKNEKDKEKAFEILSKADDLKKSYKNIKTVFDAGWVTTAHHVHNKNRFKEKEVPKLPQHWDEVYLVHKEYPFFNKTLVARNNHDGTVQLFSYNRYSTKNKG